MRAARAWVPLLALLGLAGCGPIPGALDVKAYPAEQQANYAIFENRCSRCHDLTRPVQARVAEGGWDNYVRRMARHPGAGINQADQQAIAAFLEYHHSRQAKAEEAPR
ncbi:MAG: hypothetical protein KC613_07290 [Myxococcales bacterium]|nr:hypothetical protein [Myxococcales bacterium]